DYAWDIVNRLCASEPVSSIYAHRTRTANPFVARPAECQCRIDLILDLDQSVKNHWAAIVPVDIIGVDPGALRALRVEAINRKGANARAGLRGPPDLAWPDFRALGQTPVQWQERLHVSIPGDRPPPPLTFWSGTA